MSHVAKVNFEIKDLDALDRAATALGGELVRGATAFRFYAGQQAPCLHLIQLSGDKGGHQIGLRKHVDAEGRICDDSFDLHYDLGYAHNINRAFGPQASGLRREYNAQTAEAYLHRKGHRVSRQDTPGQIRLVAIA